MEESPFPHQGPLEPSQLRGRTELVEGLIERVTERRVTALLGPRRYGKTSVLRRVAADLIEAGTAIVWVDLYEVASMADVAIRVDEALARVTGTFGQRVSRVAAAASINLGVFAVELRSPPRDRPDPLATMHGLLDVLVRTAEDTPTVVVFDEFSAVASVPGVAGLLRTKLQHHYQEIGLLFAGSEPSMMRMLFTDHVQPFYGQADLIEIEPLTGAEVVDAIQRGFTATDRGAGPIPARVAAFAGGHPQRSMQLADAAWRLVEPGEEATERTWEDALDHARAATADGHERLFSALPAGEQSVLRVLSSSGSVFGTAAELLTLANGTAQHARSRLVDNGHLVKVDDRYQLVDPLFADWIRHRFPS